ncbi:hypothetical protein POL68_12525 [Stigmatella sp. ncwal1]|uniref:Outer membrane protein beta-barrel domain-containing protein n=1 Tax=Stigmatella ashevillensis TaxID=2995309 RepID=A0ABT5D6J9_9BACT|nr:hypothetical protein [Stigmatella ashevillena]MDC0709290.1 hypothetical protein [Stigmatella ashevillena]
MRIASLLVYLLMGTAVRAEPPLAADAPSKASRAVEGALGEPVLLVGENGFMEGRLLEMSAQSLTLDIGVSEFSSDSFQLSGVREVYVQGRQVGMGAAVGSAAGLSAGALLGMFFCLFADGATSQGCLPWSGIIGAGGALVIGGLGAFVGSLIPDWDRVYERALDGPLLLSSKRASEEIWAESGGRESWPGLGQVGLFASNLLLIDADESSDYLGVGMRLNALAQIGPYVAAGPQAAFHHMFESANSAGPNSPMVSFGVLVRASPRPAILTPSLQAGFSVHTFGQTWTYSVGAGLDWRIAPGSALALELHWHQFEAPWKGGRQLTLGLGARFF